MLSSKYIAAWQPLARISGPQPCWATLVPDDVPAPANTPSPLEAAVRAAFRPVPKDQSAVRVWAVWLYRLMCRRGVLLSNEMPTPDGEEACLALAAAKPLYVARPFSSGHRFQPDVQIYWRLSPKADRVELVRR